MKQTEDHAHDQGRETAVNRMEYHVTINGIPVAASYSRRAITEIFLPLLGRLAKIRKEKGRRILVMLAAPPGAGKSTLLSFLEHLAREQALQGIQAIGMDGFHRRQEYLLSHTVLRGGTEIPMVRIKGAPVTFDLDRLAESVRRVAAGEACGWPVYDRLLHNPVENALKVTGEIVILEGNYLLLEEPGWSGLKKYADYTVSVSAEENILRKRLIDRRIKTGVDPEAAVGFVDFSDMPNVRLCLRETAPADLELRIDSAGDYHVSAGAPDTVY